MSQARSISVATTLFPRRVKKKGFWEMLNCLQISFLIIVPSTLSSLSNFGLIKSKSTTGKRSSVQWMQFFRTVQWSWIYYQYFFKGRRKNCSSSKTEGDLPSSLIRQLLFEPASLAFCLWPIIKLLFWKIYLKIFIWNLTGIQPTFPLWRNI